ncbi:MAG: molybdopterin-dependent oxidoreductase [Ahrensia sp.]|nr:molybdopterin-dependent oxidoreductase [Ahrensia sp.]
MGKILRRTFLIGGAAIVGGVAFGAYYVTRPYDNPLEGRTAEGESTFNPFVKITNDNTITIIVPRAEMGQGVTTSLAALVAEELDVTLDAIQVEHGPASAAYYNSAMLEEGAPFPPYEHGLIAETVRDVMGGVGKVLGLQVTGGSSATKDAWMKMREAGCAARETLKAAAAEREGVSASQASTDNGHVVIGDKRIPYGELAEAAAAMSPPSGMELKSESEWSLIGKSQPRTDVLAKSTGAPIFASDVRQPDMLFATVRMNPRLGGPMNSFDASEAEKIAGVVKVVDITGEADELFGGGFAVIATNSWAAFRGADAVKVDWGRANYPETSDELFQTLEAAFDNADTAHVAREDGDTDLVFADAPRDQIVEAEYRVPHLAHATMEPMNATAHLREVDGRMKLDLWTGTQAPTITQSDSAWAAGIEDASDVEIHTTYMGGGFGRRGEVDVTRHAIRVAKHTDGKPVQVIWSREEDMSHDTYRPASIGRMRGIMGDDGLPRAVEISAASPSIIGSVMARTFPSLNPAGPDNTMFQGLHDQAYAIENYKASAHQADISIPIGFWRSVGHSYNAWYFESFLDELAVSAGKDPVEMRIAMLKEHPQAVAVVEKVAEMSNWGTSSGAGTGKGIAYHWSFGAWVAMVIEVSSNSDVISIDNVWAACDLGTVVDPRIVKAQIQSGAVYGLSAALGQEITFRDGMVEQSNFHDYDAMRINQCPTITVELIKNTEHMGGAGEPGTPPAIPALANAIFAATGKRVRTMPLSKEVEFAA